MDSLQKTTSPIRKRLKVPLTRITTEFPRFSGFRSNKLVNSEIVGQLCNAGLGGKTGFHTPCIIGHCQLHTNLQQGWKCQHGNCVFKSISCTSLKMETNVKEDQSKNLIKDWLAAQQHLPQISDKKIQVFLHSCHYRVEFAKKTIDAHYRIKASTPEFFANRDPLATDIQEIQRVVELALLPKLSPKGHRIILGRLKSADQTHFSWNAAIKLLFMVCDICEVMEELIPGFLFVFDAKNFTLSHLTSMSFNTIKKYLAYTQEAMPICRKGIYVLNVNSVVNQLLSLVKPFIPAEHLKMIMLYDGVPEKLFDSIPKECLPSDYNGTQSTTQKLADATTELMHKHSNWYKEEEKLKLITSKFDKQKENAQDTVYGTEGSFKKLSID